MVDLHLVSWNRPKMTELVIKTIHRNTPREDFRLTVLDNGSLNLPMLIDLHENGLIDELAQFSENKGLEYARQFLLDNHTTTEFFVDIDNDCLPSEGWLYNQLNLMEKYEDMAAISQRNPVMVGTGNIYETSESVGMDITDFPHPGGSFRMMRTAAVEQVGGWDRNEPGRGSEEKYICGKLRAAGYGTAFSTFIKCLHLWGTKSTDYWGYDKSMKPEDSGHSPDVWHPIFDRGDDYNEVLEYCGKELTDWYFNEEN